MSVSLYNNSPDLVGRSPPSPNTPTPTSTCIVLTSTGFYLDNVSLQVQERTAFGNLLAVQGTILHDLAQSRLEVEQARLFTLKTAHLMDTVGNKAARQEIAMIKIAAPRIAQRVIDRAIQVG